ncbi:unnamed protein product [marine sediment metagenome]|uniref:Lipoprotein n=1 Tax=marine sediment metagenome TaxID=412755 RepID=X1JXY8_9ZZZZ
MRRDWTIAIALSSLCVLGGCGGNGEVVSDESGKPRPVLKELAARPDPPILDLPVPLGFDLDDGASRSADSGVARFVDHVYKGRADKFAIARFYKKSLPPNEWMLIMETFSVGELKLEFERPGERLFIFITNGGWLSSTRIKLQLWTSELTNQPSGKETDRPGTK